MLPREKIIFYRSLILQINGVLLFLHLQSAYASDHIIDTTHATIKTEGYLLQKSGKVENRTFNGPNNGTWNYSVAVFDLQADEARNFFSSQHSVKIHGANALSVTVNGNFTVGTKLDVSGKEVDFAADEKPLFWLGGFVRVNKSCCTLGAGPGGAFSYHGGGHGGRGGGFYQDRNTSRFYGWSYFDTLYLLGGSTGTVLFKSKSGSGGGAIELIAINGTLTIDAPIMADGYTSENTSDEHCAGGSSGGLIRLRGDQVVIGSNGSLSAVGGNSGYSLNHSRYCGGGGGGGVIQVFSSTDNTQYIANTSVHARGGLGIQDGEEGLEQVALYFDKEMDLMIDTTNCQMRWSGNHVYDGKIEGRNFSMSGQLIQHKVCNIQFTSTIFIGGKVRVNISGENALSLISLHGSIEINAPVDIDGSSFNAFGMYRDAKTNIGGYFKTLEDGVDSGPANVSNCSSADLYGQDFEALLGGSVCLSSADNSKPLKAAGGGALELKAENGAIVIASRISADGFSDNAHAGAMGGTVRLHASQIFLRRKAFLSARGSSQGSHLVSGGIIQIMSGADVQGICESKFNVSGGTLGLVNVLVSTANTYQVQYIQQGTLKIDTTKARWIHKTSSNGFMAYSYYGEIESKTLKIDRSADVEYKISKFEFRTPILINGSAEVDIVGENSLIVSSKEGIFIGADIEVGKSKVGINKTVGGFCVDGNKTVDGEGPGRGRPDASGGAGHAGQGGFLFEDDMKFIYGNTYGIQSHISLIGGSTGTSNDTKPDQIVACGGGAIKIYTEKNLTINAAIKANGVTTSVLNFYTSGGSSGGTIILESKKHVVLGDKATLEAKGANAVKNGGGGGGGIIVISSAEGLVGNEPTANQNTKGGEGKVPGDNGIVVINGKRRYGFPTAVLVDQDSYVGCVNISTLADIYEHKEPLKAHEASPRRCNELCRGKHFSLAFVSLKECHCTNYNLSAHIVNKTRCDARCQSNTTLICGGKGGFGSTYKTGYIPLSSSVVHSDATTVVSAVFPNKTLGVEISPTSVATPAITSSVSPTHTIAPKSPESSTTAAPEKPTATGKPTATEKPTTRPPTEPSEKFKEVANITLTEENSLNVVEQLKNLTSTAEELNGGDTKVTIEILQVLVGNESLLPKDKEKRQNLAQSIVAVASSLLSEENKENWGVKTEGKNNTTTVTSQMQVLELVENIGLKIGQQLGDNESFVIESPNIALGVDTRLPDESAPGVQYPPYDELSDDWAGTDHVFIHKEVFDQMAKDNSKRTLVVYTVYNKVSEFFPVNTSSDKVFVNSPILGIQFNKPLVTPFKKPIKLWFKKLKANTTEPSCSFVDFTQNGGTWSDNGCHVVEEKKRSVECACDHLTNFAILMQVKEFDISTDHLQALTVITYVGCGISLFGLGLTLATFLSLETLASERTSIHKNLVVAIGLAQIVFLAGIDATYNPIACKAVALFLHYLYTAAFTWMLCEGIHLYSKVVEVFSEGSKMKYYYALGWGLPLTIVFISACSRWSGYGNERACWISISDGLIWAFVAPVLIIMTVNFVVMIMVIKVIIASVTSLQNPGNTSQVRAGVKGMIVLLPLLGLTWVFGIMAINKDTIAFQYLFAILNSLQGLFIFAFHCIGNTEVRVAYKRLHEKRTLAKSLPEHSLSTSHQSREKRRMDSHETNLTGDEDIVITKTIRSVSDVKLTGDNMAMQTISRPGSRKTSIRSSTTSGQLKVKIDFAERKNLLNKTAGKDEKRSYLHVFKPKVLSSCNIV